MDSSENKSKAPILETRVYSAEKAKLSLFKTFAILVSEFPKTHSLGLRLAERSIRTRYRQSLFGFLWAFLPPLSTALLWIILNKTKVITLADVGAPYPVFVITGTLLWAVFTNSMLMPLNVMQANRTILSKINFPREAIIVSAFYEILFNAAVSFIIIIITFILFKVQLSWNILLFFPDLFLLIMLGMSFGLLLLPFAFLYRDIQFVLPTILQFAMYLTPVVYATQPFKGVASVLKYNPVSPVLTHARSSLLHMNVYVPTWELVAVAVSAFVLLILGIILQRKAMQIIIERIGS